MNASTDLAVCYYYTNQLDRALAQLDHSLALDPAPLKTLLNQGIVRFGKEDLQGAAESWEKVVALAPTAKKRAWRAQGLEGLKAGAREADAGGGGGRRMSHAARLDRPAARAVRGHPGRLATARHSAGPAPATPDDARMTSNAPAARSCAIRSAARI